MLRIIMDLFLSHWYSVYILLEEILWKSFDNVSEHPSPQQRHGFSTWSTKTILLVLLGNIKEDTTYDNFCSLLKEQNFAMKWIIMFDMTIMKCKRWNALRSYVYWETQSNGNTFISLLCLTIFFIEQIKKAYNHQCSLMKHIMSYMEHYCLPWPWI